MNLTAYLLMGVAVLVAIAIAIGVYLIADPEYDAELPPGHDK